MKKIYITIWSENKKIKEENTKEIEIVIWLKKKEEKNMQEIDIAWW